MSLVPLDALGGYLAWCLSTREGRVKLSEVVRRGRMVVYWFGMFLARGLLRVPFVPAPWREPLALRMVALASSVLGSDPITRASHHARVTGPASELFHAIFMDDSLEVARIVRASPEVLSSLFLGKVRPLERAISIESLASARVLVGLGANTDGALHQCNSVEAARLLLHEARACPHKVDAYGRNATDMTLARGNVAVAREIVLAGGWPSKFWLNPAANRRMDGAMREIRELVQYIQHQRRMVVSRVLLARSPSAYACEAVRMRIFEFAGAV